MHHQLSTVQARFVAVNIEIEARPNRELEQGAAASNLAAQAVVGKLLRLQKATVFFTS